MLQLERLFTSEQLKPAFKLGQRAFLTTSKSCCKVKPQISTLTTVLSTPNVQDRLYFRKEKLFHTDFALRKKEVDKVEEYDSRKSLMYSKEFGMAKKKDKKAFLETVRVYKQNVKNRAGHVDFIKAALKNMKAYGVHRDLESYKKLIDVFPKGVYICSNFFLVDGMYYPRQQLVTLELLRQMSINGVHPDRELGIILKNTFGAAAHPTQSYQWYLYWSLKFKNSSPFVLPQPLPSDPILLAKLAIERITSVDPQTAVTLFETQDVENAIDKTWIISGQSPKQIKLLEKHKKDVPVIVEGGDLVHLRGECINYFVLKADGEPLPFSPPGNPFDMENMDSKFFNPNYTPREVPTVHEQDDGTIYAVCATGTSSRDSLLSWVRILEKTGNPILADVPILFRFRQPEKLPAVSSEEVVATQNTPS